MTTGNEPVWLTAPPAQFQIVTCRFPLLNTAPDAPGPKLRPALVTAVFRSKRTGNIACRVAYGTSVLKIGKRQHLDVIVQHNADLALLGLASATRFDLDNLATLAWTTEFFGCWAGYPNPIIGTLTKPYQLDFAFKMMNRRSA